MSRFVCALTGALLLSACAASPAPLPVNLDPSNPDAPEGARVVTQSALDAPQVERAEAQAASQEGAAAVYSCPMHPEVRSDKPGQCPKCGMNLERQEAPAVYSCPMHPEVRSDKPGQCPKCGMNLEPEHSDHSAHPAAKPSASDHAEHAPAAPHPPDHTGHAPTQPGAPPASPGVPGTPAPKPPAARKPAKPKAVYSCPMHPEVRSDKPARCPKCGMPLELEKPKAGGSR